MTILHSMAGQRTVGVVFGRSNTPTSQACLQARLLPCLNQQTRWQQEKAGVSKESDSKVYLHASTRRVFTILYISILTYFN